jgi:hypothetical protein
MSSATDTTGAPEPSAASGGASGSDPAGGADVVGGATGATGATGADSAGLDAGAGSAGLDAGAGLDAEIDAVAEIDEPDRAGVPGDPGLAGMPGDPGLAAERDRLARSLRETRLQLAMTQARLAALEQSATMELGRTLVRAARRPWSRGAQLPADLVRLWRKRGGLTGPDAATLALASAQLSDLAGGGERFLSALTAPGLGAPGAETAAWTAPGLVITGVLTTRTCATLAPDAAVQPLLPHDADVVLESAGADLVLIEAAAMLAGSAWAYAGDPAAADRGRRLGRLIAAARALGKPVIFIRDVPAHLAPGLDWVAASCDAVSDDGFGVQLARFNPIGVAGSRPGDPVYAGARDPRERPAVRALLDAVTGESGPVRVTGAVPWRRQPALYREHALFVTAAADQAREQLACGARVVMAGGQPVAGAVTPAGDAWDVPALAERLAALRGCPPVTLAELLPVLREIFTVQATPARLAALAGLAGIGGHVVAGRRIAVLARAADATEAAALAAGLAAQEFLPAELVVVTEAPDATSAELSVRAVTAALAGLSDRGVSVRILPVVTGGPDTAGWLRRAATAADSPWAVPWHARREYPVTYLLDLACARECAQADAAGYAGVGYAFTAALDPELARREYFAAGEPGHGLRLFSVS